MQGIHVRLTVSSPPRVKTKRPSTENTIEPVSVFFVCAPSTVIAGRAKFELVFHKCNVPSKQAPAI